MSKILVGLFLIAHGLVHFLFVVPGPKDDKYPFFPEKAWLVTKLGVDVGMVKNVMLVLGVLSIIGFILAGLSYLNFVVPGEWFRVLLISSASISLLLMGISWSNYYIVGALIDIMLLYLLFTDKL
jgi:hypothetical protein